MSNNVTQELPLSAFGEVLTTQLTPIVNIEFSYNLHGDIVITRENGGTVSIDSNRVKLSTGASTNQSAQLLSKIPVKYYAGIGVVVKFTGVFTAGATGSEQLIALGDSGDAIGFGFNGSSFGVLKRNGGNPEIRSIEVTTKSTTAENITITLDGDADATVAVTDATATDATTTANEIAAHDFSNLGRGWRAIADGALVEFVSYNSEPRSGVYSLSGATTAIGSAAQILAGVSSTDDWVPQALWSGYDLLDNSGDNFIIDPTKGNIFMVVFGWLGFDGIAFFVKNPSDGLWLLVHFYSYANANTIPSLNNPTLPLMAIAENTTNTTDIITYSSSMGGFIQGKQPKPIVRHTEIIDVTFSSTTIVPAITLHSRVVFQSKVNRVRAKITNISIEVESGKSVVVKIIKEGLIVGASYAAHSTGTSIMQTDTAASAISNGEELDAFTVASGGDKDKSVDIDIEPTEHLTIAGAQVTGGANSVTKIVVTWAEDF